MTDELKALLKRCQFKDDLEVEEILIIPAPVIVDEFDDARLRYLDKFGLHIPYNKFNGMTLIGINHRPKEEAFIIGVVDSMRCIKFRGGGTVHIDVPTCYEYPRVITEYSFIVQTHVRDVLVKVREICPTKKTSCS